MEDRLVVSIAKNCLITSTLIVVFSTSLNSAAETQNNDQNQVSINSESITKTSVIRFYKANKHQQNFRIYPSKSKTSESGCHNFKRSRRIAKVVQIGYQSCSIDQDAYAQQLTEGHGWLPKPQSEKDKRGVKLRSWSCQ